MAVRSRLIAGAGSHELVIKKSRFICTVDRVASEAEARTFVTELRKRYWGASHNCAAWVVGERGELQRSNDDGEPSGTADAPMLNVLNRRELTDTVAVVTRYFGGTLLGAGGLIRAYGQSLSETIDRVGIVVRKPLSVVAVDATHDDAGRLDYALRGTRYLVAGIDYGATVTFQLHLDGADLSPFASWLAETTSGRCAGRAIGIEHVEVPVKDEGE